MPPLANLILRRFPVFCRILRLAILANLKLDYALQCRPNFRVRLDGARAVQMNRINSLKAPLSRVAPFLKAF